MTYSDHNKFAEQPAVADITNLLCKTFNRVSNAYIIASSLPPALLCSSYEQNVLSHKFSWLFSFNYEIATLRLS